MQDNSKTKYWWLLLIIIVGVLVPFGFKYYSKFVDVYAENIYEPSTIVVDTRNAKELNKVWGGIAQGYEDPSMRLDKTAEKLQGTEIKYIKLDHVLDGYNLLTGIDEEGQLQLDFYTLDLLVSDIISMGATPYFSLSFTPSQLTDGSVYDVAKNQEEWQVLVNEFVRHYSSKYSGIIYEVWNEPDINGSWKTFTQNKYVDFYELTAISASSVNYRPYIMGGPALSKYNGGWMADYLGEIGTVRRDFVSWHAYSSDVEDIVRDAVAIERDLEKYGKGDMDIYLSEFGITKENSPLNDGNTSAAHMIAVMLSLVDTDVDMAMPYMLRDSGFAESAYHGGRGMVTNPGYGGIAKKPRMIAYEMLNEMQGDRVPLAGEGSYVRALSTKDSSGTFRVIVVNYDYMGEHQESFPLKLAGLNPGEYEVDEKYLSGKKSSTTVTVGESPLSRDIVLEANDILLMTVKAK